MTTRKPAPASLMSPETTPTKLDLQRDKQLTIAWQDGTIATYAIGYLRAHCPCAKCKEERKTSPPPEPGKKRTSLNVKGIYAFTKNWSFTGGYAYERTRYSDVSYDGYQYTLPYPGVTNNTGQSYLNGYRAFTNADANIFYVLATYKF